MIAMTRPTISQFQSLTQRMFGQEENPAKLSTIFSPLNASIDVSEQNEVRQSVVQGGRVGREKDASRRQPEF